MTQMRRTWALIGALATVACTTSTAPVLDGLTSARAMGAVCMQGGQLSSAANCPNDAGLRVLVGGGSRGSLALANPAAALFLDTDPKVPGITPLQLPGLPIDMAIDPAAKVAYVLVGGAKGQVVAVSLASLAKDRLLWVAAREFGFAPGAVALFNRKTGAVATQWLAVTDPAHGLVHAAPTAQLTDPAAWQPWAIGGSPRSLLYVPGSGDLWIGHLHHAWVHRIGEAAAPPGVVISIERACRNGLDDDGDGKTDNQDRGCDDPDDDSEADVELGVACTNGVDDDGNGLTDGADVHCQGGPGLDACRNGVDDDGDGQTDAGADPGCANWSDPSEWSDNPACQDGQDNDGDGKTDAADPECAAGDEWTRTPGHDQLPTGQAPVCANGLDDDGDGSTDSADPDCWSRGGNSEVGPALSPAAVLAATAKDRVVAVAHQGRREVLFIDTQSNMRLHPVRGEGTPFLRTSRLDERDGVLGLTTAGRPTALVGYSKANAGLVGIAASPGGFAVAQVTAAADAPIAIAWIAAGGDTQSTVGKPVLTIDGKAQDLGGAIPPRWASLGPLRTEQKPDGKSFFGIQPSTSSYDHRSEQWTLAHRAALPGSNSDRGAWAGPGQLHDPYADFCRLGAVPGDRVVLAPGPACAQTGPVQVRIVSVGADTLVVDPASARAVAPVTVAKQFETDLADPAANAAAPVVVDPACWRHGQVTYHVAADGWLLVGSRSGLLSQRGRLGAACQMLPSQELLGARVAEPTLRRDAAGKPLRPASCPYAGGVLDPAFEPAPTHNPVFAHLNLLPGCRSRALPDGKVAVQVLPSVDGASWVFQLTAGARPFTVSMGSENTALLAGSNLTFVYGLDSGSGALFAVDPTGVQKTVRME
ncbi:MAG: hypothetical protein FJ100_19740 [Deltaproteobacteria bacterium]|nr:hypothetical protein [Deltaproteobacteria bacterium]